MNQYIYSVHIYIAATMQVVYIKILPVLKIQYRRSGQCYDSGFFFFSLIYAYDFRIWVFSRQPPFPVCSSPGFVVVVVFVLSVHFLVTVLPYLA